MSDARKIRIGNKEFSVRDNSIIEAFDINNNSVYKVAKDGSQTLNNPLMVSQEITSSGGEASQNNNYQTLIEDSTGDLVTYWRDAGEWKEVLRLSQRNGDKALVLSNRGLTLGTLEGAEQDTELVIGTRGDSTVEGMSVLTSPDNTNFTDVTDTASSSTGSTFKGFSDNPQVGATDYFGWDYPFCNFKLKTAVAATVDGSSAVAREYWNGSAWTSFPVMTVDSTTLEQRANNIGSVVGTEQIRFACPDDFTKTTINGIEKYWIRFRVTGALLTAPSVEQIKVGTDRWECESNGRTVYYGSAEYKTDLPLPFKTLFNLVGSTPGDANITVSPNITIAGVDNLFNNNAKDGKTGGFTIPRGMDTSVPIEFTVSYAADDATAGDIELELITSQVKVGDVLDGTLAETAVAEVVSVNNEQDVFKKTTFSVSVEDLAPGDSVTFSFFRDATAGNVDDTYTGAIKVSLFNVRGTFFTP